MKSSIKIATLFILSAVLCSNKCVSQTWMMYLSGMVAEEMPEEVAKDEMISQALDLKKQFLQNQEERQRYITSYKAMVDDLMTDETIRRVARDEGLVEGEAKGKVEGIAATAWWMLNRGVSPEQVADFTG